MPSGRVWVDVLTPKQVLFFNPLVAELRERGCEVLVTSREYREVRPMAEMVGLEMRYVGERGAQGRLEQLTAATRRQEAIIPIVSDFRPGVSVSVASGVCARVSYGLGLKHVAVNDSPHSEVAGRLSLPLSQQVMCPWVIPYDAWSRFGIARSQVTRYRALDPVAWLRRKPTAGPIPRLSPGRKTIVIRAEESDAPYMAGTDKTWVEAVLESVAEGFPECNLVVLSRYRHQLEAITRKFGDRMSVPEGIVDGRRLLSKSDLLVGMGGTMTAEAALMGVPAISMFQGSYIVEDYLRRVGLAVKTRSPTGLVRVARRFMTPSFRKAFAGRSRHILGSMEDPVPRIAGKITSILEQG